MLETVEFCDLVDDLLKDCGRSAVPVIPGAIADALAELFYRNERPEEFLQYRMDIEHFVRSRLRILVCGKAN